MPKQRVKAQHYVPRTYLRRFADGNERLWAFDKPRGQAFFQSVASVAQEKFFYDVGEDDPQRPGQRVYPEEQPVEEMFHGIEGKYRPITDEIIGAPENGIPAEHLPFLAEFIVAQILRTREERQHAVEMVRAMKWMQLSLLARNTFPELDHSTIEPLLPTIDETEAHLLMLLNMDAWTAMHKALLGHVWMLGVNETASLIHTSDHPVVKRGTQTDSPMGSTGVASPGVEIYFPLSPRHILMIYERSHSHALPHRNLTSVQVDEDNVIYFNDLQAGTSYRQVYSLDDSFDMTRRRVLESPWCAEPDRKRIEVSGGPFGKFPG